MSPIFGGRAEPLYANELVINYLCNCLSQGGGGLACRGVAPRPRPLAARLKRQASGMIDSGGSQPTD